MSPQPHIVLIGSGITSLTIARSLLSRTPLLSLHLTIIDKARSPGGRLTSRTYDDNGVTLETGARAFQSSYKDKQSGFDQECRDWESRGWVKEVEASRLRGVDSGKMGGSLRWWEGVGGISQGLISGLVQDINRLGQGRSSWHYNTALEPLSPSSTESTLAIQTTPPISLEPISLLVDTAPSPQASVLHSPYLPTPTSYLKTFTLLLPSVSLPPSLPVYHRDPSASITSISTGISAGGNQPQGLVIQSSPEKLGLDYARENTSDAMIKLALLDAVRRDGLLPESIIREAETAVGKASQIKRWKFAQIEGPLAKTEEGNPAKYNEDAIQVLDDGRIVLAGDGTAGGKGGVEGAWRAGVGAADYIVRILKRGQ